MSYNAVQHIQSLLGQRLHFLRVAWLLVRRDLKIKYRESVLGYLWSMLNPLLSMIVITVVFSNVVRGIPYYGLHVLSGVLAWNMGSGILVQGTHSIANGTHLLRKVKMPAWILPVVPGGACTVNFLLALIPYFIIHTLFGAPLSWRLGLFPLVLASFLLFSLGIALMLAIFNAFFRDVGHVLEPILQLLFYATPIIYDRKLSPLPEWLRGALAWNPYTHFIEAFRACLIPQPDWSPQKLLVLIALALTASTVGLVCYKFGKRRLMFRL